MKSKFVLFAVLSVIPVRAFASWYTVTEVEQEFQVIDKKGVYRKIPEGKYTTEWEYDFKRLRIKFYDASFGKDVEFRAEIGPVNAPDNGEFEIDAKKLGQEFSLAGTSSVTTQKYGPISATETCAKEFKNDYGCWDLPDGGRRCGWRDVTHRGTQSVAYNIIRTKYSYLMRIVRGPEQEILASFPLEKTQERRERVFEGECIIH